MIELKHLCYSLWVGVGLYFAIGLWNRFETYRNTDIVIARYKEPLEPLISSPTYTYFRKIYIYNKGPAITEIDWLPSNVEIIELPNVGCESHTYLYHMISKRNCLAEKTLFVPASFQSLYYKRGMMVVLMKWLPSYDYGFSCLPCVVDLKTDFNDFSLSRYQHSSKANHAIDTQLVQCADRPFGTWYEKNFNNLHVKLSGTQGMFFVTRDKIMAHDASEYCQLIAYVDKDRNPEAGHYMERAWTALYLGE